MALVGLATGCVDYTPVSIDDYTPSTDGVTAYTSPSIPAPLPKAAASCDNTEPTRHQFRILFEEVQPNCAWGTDGNLPQTEGVLSARVTQVHEIDMTQFDQICEIDFDFDPDGTGQTMAYDDELFLVLNDIVLLASDESQVHQFAEDGLFRWYDWNDLAGTVINFSPAVPPYCLGQAEGWTTCSVPDAHTTGAVSLKMDTHLVRALGEEIIDAEQMRFQMVAAGDNDPSSDCAHSAFEFEVSIEAL